MSRKLSWWIKERFNPQIGTYYVLEGQLSKKDAKKKTESLYGYNIMLEFRTEQEYMAAYEQKIKEGARFTR